MKKVWEKDVLICECNSTDHQMVLLYNEEEYSTGSKYNLCYAHVHLNKRPLLQRIKYAIKYIFGYKCNYGAFDEFIFNPEDADKLQELVNYLKTERENEKTIFGRHPDPENR